MSVTVRVRQTATGTCSVTVARRGFLWSTSDTFDEATARGLAVEICALLQALDVNAETKETDPLEGR